MTNNLYLKKFASEDSLLDKARIGAAEAIEKHPILYSLLGAGLGGTAGYLTSNAVDKALEKKYKIKPKWYTKIFPTVAGTVAGGAMPLWYYSLNEKDVLDKFNKEKQKEIDERIAEANKHRHQIDVDDFINNDNIRWYVNKISEKFK